MEGPIKFITLDGPIEDENSKYALNPEAVKELNKIEGHISVISVAGLYRTGKSFVLNQLAGSQNGFDIGATVEPCTEGVWMWIIDAKKAHPNLAPKDSTVILLDTEGLGSYQKTTTHDVKIFSFAVLLCSYFIYNSLGTIDDNAMDKLSLVVELTKYIRAQGGENGQDPAQLSYFFPKFLWLVRDFSLELISGGKPITAEEYLEKALVPLTGDDEDIQSKNTIRQCITQAFRERTCFTLKRPVNDEELLQNLSEISKDQFRPEFLKQMSELTEIIYSNVRPKKLYGHFVNGPMLGVLAANYVEAINKGTVPTISSAWESVVKIEGAKALESALALYEKLMEDAFKAEPIMELEKLDQVHSQSKASAVSLFRKKAVGDDVRSFEDELESTISKSFGAKQIDNMKKSSEFCQELLKKLLKDISLAVSDGSVNTTEKLETSYQNFLRAYEKESKGPAKYFEFFKSAGLIFDQARKVTQLEVTSFEEKAAKKLQEEKEKSKKEYERLDKLYQTIDAEWKKSEDEGKALKAENKNYMVEVQKLEKKLKNYDSLEQENAELKKKLQSYEKSKPKPEDESTSTPKMDSEDHEEKKKKKKCSIM